ncbi:MAG: DUF6436 domain-containing protein [Pontibacterium sp.]
MLVLVLWLALVLVGFWWFQWRWYFLVDTQTVWFKSDPWVSASPDKEFSLKASQSGDIGALVVHFYDPACPCSKFNTEHVLSLIAEYQIKGVHFELRVPHPHHIEEAEDLFGVVAKVVSPQKSPSASPSALVLGTGGEEAKWFAAYVGPYSSGAVCSGGDDDFVGLALDRLLSQEKVWWESNLASGCLCPWPKFESQGT